MKNFQNLQDGDEMTEFTKEYIRSVRMCSYLIEPPASEVIEHLCDEIERQAQRIAELEAHNKDFHLACINALDLHRESDVPKLKDIPNIIEEIRERNQKLEIQLKSKDIIINNQQGRLNYYATKDLLGGKNERNTR